MDWMVVLSSGTQLLVSEESAAALVVQVTRATMNGAPVSVDNGVLVRVQDVLLIAPHVSSPPAQQVKLQARVNTAPRKQAD